MLAAAPATGRSIAIRNRSAPCARSVYGWTSPPTGPRGNDSGGPRAGPRQWRAASRRYQPASPLSPVVLRTAGCRFWCFHRASPGVFGSRTDREYTKGCPECQSDPDINSDVAPARRAGSRRASGSGDQDHEVAGAHAAVMPAEPGHQGGKEANPRWPLERLHRVRGQAIRADPVAWAGLGPGIIRWRGHGSHSDRRKRGRTAHAAARPCTGRTSAHGGSMHSRGKCAAGLRGGPPVREDRYNCLY